MGNKGKIESMNFLPVQAPPPPPPLNPNTKIMYNSKRSISGRSHVKVADKRRSEYKDSLLERLLACYLIDSPGNLQYIKGPNVLQMSKVLRQKA